jgi:2,4-diaminopentanoate dehydrogenase
MTAHGTAVFGEAVRMVGDALGIKLDEVRCDAEYAQTTEGVDLGSWTIPAGCVAGAYASSKGTRRREGGRGDCRALAQGPDPQSDWTIQQDGRVIEVADRPTATTNAGFPPFPDFEATTLEEFMVLGHIMTATHRCTIPAVAAAPGIVTYNGVPLILPRGVAALT